MASEKKRLIQTLLHTILRVTTLNLGLQQQHRAETLKHLILLATDGC